MTVNQFIAMIFPVLTAAAVAVVVLFVTKPRSKSLPAVTGGSLAEDVRPEHMSAAESRDIEIRTALLEAEALIRKAERQLSKAATH